MPTKVHLVKATIFPVVMYGCESWTVSQLSAEKLKLLNCGVGEDLRVPWTAGRSNQSILKEISPGCSLEGLMMKLKLQYFGHLMQRVDSLEKTLMLGEIGGRRKRGRQRMRRLDGIPTRWAWVWANSGSLWWTGRPGVLWFMGLQRVRHDWATELNWSVIHSVVPDSLRPHALQPTRLLCPWDFPGNCTGMGCHSLFQGIFPTQGSKPGLLHCRQILYQQL